MDEFATRWKRAVEAIVAGDDSKLSNTLSEFSQVDCQDPTDGWTNGWTLLNHAIEHDRPAILQLLIDRGVPVQTAAHGGMTPLHHAIDLEADARNQDGEPADGRLVHILVAAGADPTARDDRGQTPVDSARDCQHWIALQLMQGLDDVDEPASH